MSEVEKEKAPGMGPGVCVPWDENAAEFGPFSGDAEIVRNQWEKLDAAAYMYLWWWVHR